MSRYSEFILSLSIRHNLSGEPGHTGGGRILNVIYAFVAQIQESV